MERTKENKLRFNSVLIVDDNELDLYIEKNMFITFAEVKTIYTKKNGDSALHFLKTMKDTEAIPELVILDVRMPGISVFNFANEFEELIRERDCCSRIVLLSAYFAMEEELIQIAESIPIIDKCLHKPLNVEQLV